MVARVFIRGPLVRCLARAAWLGRLAAWLWDHPCPHIRKAYYPLFRQVIESEHLDGPILYLEFGVYKGTTMRWWTRAISHPEARFVGFDTFEGLPEAYGSCGRGSYTAGGQVPDIGDPRCRFEVGFFQDTLRGFLQTAPRDRRYVVYLDADLYSSTLYVLTTLAPVLKKGDVLIFDDFASIREPVHVFRAFDDFCAAYRPRFTVLAGAFAHSQLAIRME
jgi:hypothetical protein